MAVPKEMGEADRPEKPAWRRGHREHRYTGEQDGRKKDAGLAARPSQRVHKAGGKAFDLAGKVA